MGPGADKERDLHRPGDILIEVHPSAPAVLDLFRQTGAYLKGHFRLTSGLHSPEYLQCAKVLQYPEHAERLGRELAALLRGGGPAPSEVARAFGCRSFFAERDAEGKMVLRRGFEVEPGELAVVVEDVVTTGGSSREVIEMLHAAGADVIAAGSIIDRSGGHADLGVPRVALVTLQAITYPPEDCPLCREGVPVVKPGSRPAAKP